MRWYFWLVSQENKISMRRRLWNSCTYKVQPLYSISLLFSKFDEILFCGFRGGDAMKRMGQTVDGRTEKGYTLRNLFFSNLYTNLAINSMYELQLTTFVWVICTIVFHHLKNVLHVHILRHFGKIFLTNCWFNSFLWKFHSRLIWITEDKKCMFIQGKKWQIPILIFVFRYWFLSNICH